VSDALVSLLTGLGDDELVLGHRHSEWTGYAPHIEEDVAFSSIAQDEIGHAAAYYALVAGVSGGDADAFALGRPADDYRHALLCERPNGDWAFTLARHWLYDHADALRLEGLEESSHEGLAALARKIRREERYHLIHADLWIKRVAQGPAEGRSKLVDAMARAWPEARGLFEPFEGEEEAVYKGWLPTPSAELATQWTKQTAQALDEIGLPTEIHGRADESAEFVASSSGDLIAAYPRDRLDDRGVVNPRDRLDDRGVVSVPDGFGGRRGHHTDDFTELWEVMTGQYRAHPGATW
jgi:ring-1,2-phenylacetyl-CoA epoxidase subunit PaaC